MRRSPEHSHLHQAWNVTLTVSNVHDQRCVLRNPRDLSGDSCSVTFQADDADVREIDSKAENNYNLETKNNYGEVTA